MKTLLTIITTTLTLCCLNAQAAEPTAPADVKGATQSPAADKAGKDTLQAGEQDPKSGNAFAKKAAMGE